MSGVVPRSGVRELSRFGLVSTVQYLVSTATLPWLEKKFHLANLQRYVGCFITFLLQNSDQKEGSGGN
jgi:hypothetical protein